MDISCACHEFLRPLIATSLDREENEDFCLTERICSLDERRSIEKSAQHCRLCQRIHVFLDNQYASQFDLPDGENWLPVNVRLSYSCLNADENRVSSIFCWTTAQEARADMSFAVWAERETPASRDLVTWAPVLQEDFPETTQLVQKFFTNCLNYHEECRAREPAEGFDLPSRVLSIEENSGNISVKLVENNGLSGKYCALSHCWGSKDKQPPKTTKKTLQDHLVSIPWDTLPPLFRDTITLTKSFDIDYLWIDSLCIIQDDKQDWINEAKKMSSVYRRAALVIAAVDAKDSTQRLSKAKRPESITFRVPYYTQEESAEGVYCIAESTDLLRSVKGPLRQRGWVLQELYLARRKIFFTSKGLSWSCGLCGANERGNSVDLGLYETSSWLSCLEQYSSKHLTYPSDRIAALLGIVEHIGQSRSDSFFSESGVWANQLVEQLLWRSLEIRDEDLPDLPSWSWAATGGNKDWRRWDDLCGAMINGGAQTVILADSGSSLHASGILMRATVAALPMRVCCMAAYRATTEAQIQARDTIERSILPGYAGETHNLSRFPILNGTETCQVLGLAMFDRRVYHAGCFFFILASARRAVTDICHPDFVEETDGGEGIGVGDGEDAWSGVTHRDSDECVDMIELGRGVEVYWALLLHPIDESLTKFKRVGLALLWPQVMNIEDGEFNEFDIV